MRVSVIGGGTLAEAQAEVAAEVGFAGVLDRPIAGLDTRDAPGVEPVESPAEAVAFVESAARDDAEFRKG